MNWSPQQEQALRLVAQWMRDPNAPQVFYLAGFAGTGKSTIAKALVEQSGKRWLFAAFTGKAAHVLKQKGCSDAGTIHSIIYRPIGEDDGTQPTFARWASSPLNSADVAGIVVDEVSMVDEHLGRDLESFGKKILVLGDPAQLPPVKGGGYFTNREPDALLTEVHRHAKESGVLRLATHIREGGSVRGFTSYGGDVELVTRKTDREVRSQQALAADQVLVGRNKTRHDSNARYRQLTGRIDPLPYEGDRLVCLRNNHELGLFNGSQWIVVDSSPVKEDVARFELRSEDDDRRIFRDTAWLHHFLGRGEELAKMGKACRSHAEFDWGYALTVHKAQGSQWDRVLVVDESGAFRDDSRRWLYTAVTRAAKHVAVMSL